MLPACGDAKINLINPLYALLKRWGHSTGKRVIQATNASDFSTYKVDFLISQGGTLSTYTYHLPTQSRAHLSTFWVQQSTTHDVAIHLFPRSGRSSSPCLIFAPFLAQRVVPPLRSPVLPRRRKPSLRRSAPVGSSPSGLSITS